MEENNNVVLNTEGAGGYEGSNSAVLLPTTN